MKNKSWKKGNSSNMRLYHVENTNGRKSVDNMFMSHLNNKINELIECIKPSREENGLRRLLVRKVERMIMCELNEIKKEQSGHNTKQKDNCDARNNIVVCIGSYATRLHLPASDINITISTDEKDVLVRLKNAIYTNNFIYPQSVWLPQNAKMPMLKFVDLCGFRYNVTLNNTSGIEQTKTAGNMLKRWPNFKKMVLFVRHFLKSHGLYEDNTIGLCLNAQLLLLDNFFAMHSYLIRNLPKERDISILILEFFKFYGFDPNCEKAKAALLRYRKNIVFSYLFTDDSFEKSSLMKKIRRVCGLFTDAHKKITYAAQHYVGKQCFDLLLWVSTSYDDDYWRKKHFHLYYRIANR